MANIFYTPSGNPGTRAEGLSALLRGEFIAIAAAFDLLPSILTTGGYQTTFNQVGNYTFTLPGFPGTLATLADVATETARAKAAEAGNTTAISTETSARTTAVATETARAIAAESTNTTAISTEASARTIAVATEMARATTAEDANAAAISAETSARTAAIAAEVIARNAAIAASAPELFAAAHDVSGSRTPGTTYTNTTGKPMFVAVSAISISASLVLLMKVDGVVTGSAFSAVDGWANVTGMVPPGKSYVFTVGTTSGINWSETW